MKLKALLSALLVMALLLCPVATMEDAPEPQLEDFERIFSESVDDIIQEQSVDLSEAEASLGESDEPEPMEARLAEGASDIVINAANFPDAKFRACIAKMFNKTEGDSLSAEELAGTKKISIRDESIADLTGIHLFPNLENLECSKNQLTTLDVTHNTKLERLECDNNQLTTLDVSHNSALSKLDCGGNQLTTLDVSHNSALNTLECGNNQLTTLDVSQNSALSLLLCGGNQLTTLDVTHNTKLQGLECDNNQLTTLDVSHNSALITLRCYNNQLMTLDVSHDTELLWLDCRNNQLTTLDVSHNTWLGWLECENNKLKTLDVSHDTELVVLDCSNNQLTTLDVSHNTSLWVLVCTKNSILTLDLRKCPKIVKYINSDNFSKSEDGKEYYYYNSDEWSLCCDSFVTIIGGNPVAPTTTTTPTPVVTTDPTPTPVSDPTSTPIPAISMLKKNNKASMEVNTVGQIDLGGKVGKKFKSSKKKVATVDQNGLITALSAGKTKITVKVGKQTRKLTLTVIDPTIPSAVYLDQSGTIKVKKGETMTLTASVPEGTDAGGFKWKSSNKKVATVSNGVVTFKKKGRVTITATAVRGKKKAKVKFKVTN